MVRFRPRNIKPSPQLVEILSGRVLLFQNLYELSFNLVKERFDGKLRAMFTVDEGNYLVGTDAESIQLRILAHYLKNDDYVKAITEGRKEDGTDSALAISINSHHEETTIRLPATPHRWRVSFSNGVTSETLQTNRTLTLSGRSIALLKR